MRQKVDGLMDITAREAGSFYTPGRTTLDSRRDRAGPQDIADWDDTTLTTVAAQLDYAVAKAWTLSAGYCVREVRVQGRVHGRRPADAAVHPDLPEVELDGGYNANVLYGRVSYRF